MAIIHHAIVLRKKTALELILIVEIVPNAHPSTIHKDLELWSASMLLL